MNAILSGADDAKGPQSRNRRASRRPSLPGRAPLVAHVAATDQETGAMQAAPRQEASREVCAEFGTGSLFGLGVGWCIQSAPSTYRLRAAAGRFLRDLI
jgi:hypothetical protein